MHKNKRELAHLLAAYACFAGVFLQGKPRNEAFIPPSKGMPNANLKSNNYPKNRRKRPKKGRKKT